MNIKQIVNTIIEDAIRYGSFFDFRDLEDLLGHFPTFQEAESIAKWVGDDSRVRWAEAYEVDWMGEDVPNMEVRLLCTE